MVPVTAPAFTPGPWREGIDGNNRVYGPNCAGEHTGLIAVVYKGRANIRLIAAAPDLHEACGDALELLNREVITPDALNAVGRALQAALAKARGEQ